MNTIHKVLISCLLLTSCSVYQTLDFSGKIFSVSSKDLGIYGECQLIFKNDTLILYEHNTGNLYARGYWTLNGKEIVIDYYNKLEAQELNLLKETGIYSEQRDTTITITNRKKIQYRDLKYWKEKTK